MVCFTANPLRKKFDFALEQEEEQDTTAAEIDEMAAELKKQEVSATWFAWFWLYCDKRGHCL